jgi:Leucine-rich repeat (LRR) protein
MIFDSNFEKPEKVAEVKIDFSSFGKIINGIGKHFLTLEKLTVRGIKFLSFKNFYDLQNLKELNLRGNKNLRIFDRAFKNLKYLERLDLSDCLIKRFPYRVFKFLKKLKWIDLGGNMLTEIDGTLWLKNRQLEFINLNFNKLHTIEFNFTRLSNLKAIKFDINDEICEKPFKIKEINYLSRSSSAQHIQKIFESKCFRGPECGFGKPNILTY